MDTDIYMQDSSGSITMTAMPLKSGKTGFVVRISNKQEPIVGTTRRKMDTIFAGTTTEERLCSVLDLLEVFKKKYCPYWTEPAIERLSFGTTPEGTLERVSCVAHYGSGESDSTHHLTLTELETLSSSWQADTPTSRTSSSIYLGP